MMNNSHNNKPKVNQEISSKNEQFRNQIRYRQRQGIFKAIRQQYQFLYTASLQQKPHKNYSHQMNEQMISHSQCEQTSEQKHQIEQYPLFSKTLEKFHTVSHSDMWKHLTSIEQQLMQNNIYLSLLNEEQEDQTFDEQSLLIHDLFYLSLQHSPPFTFPRKFKFIRNGSFEVASYVSIVSNAVMPDQLAYWMAYMGEEERSFAYTNITIDQPHSDMEQSTPKNNFHYQSWVNHPVLRNYLVSDFAYIEEATKAIKQIVCFRKVHPDRFKNKRGESLYQVICQMFHKQLEGMKQVQTQYEQGGQSFSDRPTKLIVQHMEISVKVIEAKLLQHHNCMELIQLLSKIMSTRVESQMQLISPLFCQWVVDALLNYNYQVIDKLGYIIMINMMKYDPDKFITKIEQVCTSKTDKVGVAKLEKLESIIFCKNQKMGYKIDEQSQNNMQL